VRSDLTLKSDQAPGLACLTYPSQKPYPLLFACRPPWQSPKGIGLRTMVRTEFRKNAKVTDPLKIEDLRAAAVRALSNYLLYESGAKDPRVKQRMDEQGMASETTRAVCFNAPLQQHCCPRVETHNPCIISSPGLRAVAPVVLCGAGCPISHVVLLAAPLATTNKNRQSVSGGLVPPRPVAGIREEVTAPKSAMDVATSAAPDR